MYCPQNPCTLWPSCSCEGKPLATVCCALETTAHASTPSSGEAETQPLGQLRKGLVQGPLCGLFGLSGLGQGPAALGIILVESFYGLPAASFRSWECPAQPLVTDKAAPLPRTE